MDDDMAYHNNLQSWSEDLDTFDLELLNLLSNPSNPVSFSSTTKTDGDRVLAIPEVENRPPFPETKLSDISWVGNIAWSRKLLVKFKSHEKLGSQFYSKLGYCKMIWKTLVFPHPLVDWRNPCVLLEVDRKRSSWQDDDDTFYIPVFETSVVENCHIPIKARSWDLIIPPKCAHVGRQMARNVLTTVIVWGAEAIPFDTSEGKTQYPQGIIRFDENKTTSFVIYHHEKITPERILDIKLEFEKSELASFDEYCTSAVYESSFRNDITVQLISVTPNKLNELNQLQIKESEDRKYKQRQTLSYTLFGSESESNSRCSDLSDSEFLTRPSRYQPKISALPPPETITHPTNKKNDVSENGKLNEIHRVVQISDNTSKNTSLGSDDDSEHSFCTANSAGSPNLSGEIIPSTPPTVITITSVKSLARTGQGQGESFARKLFQDEDNPDLFDSSNQQFVISNGHETIDKEMEFLFSEEMMCENTEIDLEMDQDDNPQHQILSQANSDCNYSFTPYITEL